MQVVVNVGRAEVVDEDALWDALQGHCQDGPGAARLAFGADVWWSESGIVAKPTAPKGEAGQMVTPPPAAPPPAPEPAAAAEEAVPPVVFPSKCARSDSCTAVAPPLSPSSSFSSFFCSFFPACVCVRVCVCVYVRAWQWLTRLGE